MLVNAAAFYTDYEGIQLNFQEGASPVLHNAGDAKIKGFEIESTAILGGGLSLNFAGGYMDAYYTKDRTRSADPDQQQAAEDAGVEGDGRGRAISSRCRTTARCASTADYTKTAELFNDSLNTPELRRPSTSMLNAAITYLAPGDNFEIALGGTNLTNDRWLTTGSINLAAGEKVRTYNRPLEWYLSARVNVGP